MLSSQLHCSVKRLCIIQMSCCVSSQDIFRIARNMICSERAFIEVLPSVFYRRAYAVDHIPSLYHHSHLLRRNV